jgi:hypothetical protein
VAYIGQDNNVIQIQSCGNILAANKDWSSSWEVGFTTARSYDGPAIASFEGKLWGSPPRWTIIFTTPIWTTESSGRRGWISVLPGQGTPLLLSFKGTTFPLPGQYRVGTSAIFVERQQLALCYSGSNPF